MMQGNADDDAPWAFEIRNRLGAQQVPRLPRPQPSMPTRRRLRVFAQDPSLSYDEGAIYTVSIPYEPLRPGPDGALLSVLPLPMPQEHESHESASRRRAPAKRKKPLPPPLAEPVDLDRDVLLIEDGLTPSTTNRQFIQQMVYAVCMETYGAFVCALGRDPGFGPLQGPGRDDGRLRIKAMGFHGPNAYYDRETSSLVFGYGKTMRGTRDQAGTEVYIALSRDVVGHEMSHAMLDSLRPNFLRPTHRDIGGLHEGFSDLVALFSRFAQRETLERAIARTQGGVKDDLLMSLGKQFGFDLLNGDQAMRSAAEADPYYTKISPDKRYTRNREDHDLGAVLLSAVFDAFSTIYERNTGAVKQSFALYQGRLPHEGVVWLAKEAAKIAKRFLNIIIRAVDYCPPLHCSFGEYLRALITADHDLVGDDGALYRQIVIASFRKFGITVPDVPTLSEESLLWKPPQSGPIRIEALRFSRLALDFEGGLCEWSDGEVQRHAAQALGETICRPKYARDFGLMRPDERRGIQPPVVLSLRTLRRVSPNEDVSFDLVAEVVQKRKVREGWFLGGSTIVISSAGEVRYAVAKHIDSARRLEAQRQWLRGKDKETRDAAWDPHSAASAALIARLHRERSRAQEKNAVEKKPQRRTQRARKS